MQERGSEPVRVRHSMHPNIVIIITMISTDNIPQKLQGLVSGLYIHTHALCKIQDVEAGEVRLTPAESCIPNIDWKGRCHDSPLRFQVSATLFSRLIARIGGLDKRSPAVGITRNNQTK